MSVRVGILKARLREWLLFHSAICGSLLRLCMYFAGVALFRMGNEAIAFKLLSSVHRAGSPKRIADAVERLMRRSFSQQEAGEEGYPFDNFLREHVATARERAQANLADNPDKLWHSMAIVVSPAQDDDRRGVVIMSYNYVFPLLMNQYDFSRITERYHLVLEPSWSGYCNPDLMCYHLLRPNPVFIQAYEPRDSDYLKAIQSNLVAIPVSANWWVDHRIFSPDPNIEKDLDFVMVASWADFKRHHRFFQTLRTLRTQGKELRGVCAGYPAGSTLESIRARARYYGVEDLIEFHEFIPQDQIANLMNRARVNVVWSLKEGVNRVIIEGMFCDVPCLLPEGFNYGFRYPYVNEFTGRWSNDDRLANDLLEMTQQPWPHSPAEWIREHITPQAATAIIKDTIERSCEFHGELPPNPDYAVKINGLHGMDYWDKSDRSRFESDYDFLRSTLTAEALPGTTVADNRTGNSRETSFDSQQRNVRKTSQVSAKL